MANARTNGIAGKLLGASLALSAAFAPSTASAEDVAMAALPDAPKTVDTILCEADQVYYEKDGWTSEVADLDCAADGARDYAENNPGVGVLIHVGTGSFGEGKRFATPQEFGEAVVRTFENRYDVNSAYFLRQTTGPATGLTYHVGEFIHGANNGTEVKNVKEALEAMPEVAGMLRLLWEDQLAAAQADEPSPLPGG